MSLADTRGPDQGTVERRTLALRAPLHVEEVSAGATGNETFVLIHGYGASSYMWRHWAEPLALRGRVLLVDLKGFGEAPKPDDGRYGPVDLAEAVVELFEELDLRGVTLCGQSLGGGVALLTAIMLRDRETSRTEADATAELDVAGRPGGSHQSPQPARVTRLVLLAPAAYKQRLPPFVWLSERPRLASALLRTVGPRRVVRWAARAVVFDPDTVTDDQVDAYARALLTPEGRRAALCAGRQIIPPNIEEIATRYGELDTPTLILWGDTDRVVPIRLGRRLAGELPRADFVVLRECGHVAPEERPTASLGEVERFLDRTP